MSNWRDTIADLLGIETYESENKRLQMEVDSLSRQAAAYKVMADGLERQVKLLQASDEGRLEILREDVAALEDTYHKRITEYDRLIELAKQDIAIAEERMQMADRMFYKGKTEGRQDAYSEMGIWNIEAHERDNILVRLPDGEVVEQILGLEDVKPSTDGVLSDDEITIDDLVDTTA